MGWGAPGGGPSSLRRDGAPASAQNDAERWGPGMGGEEAGTSR